MNFYNENDPKAAAWLRELIADGLIPKGHVDERSITEIKPDDLSGFSQCHFFAGIGGWPLALTLAGWPEDKPIFTLSCPCQPFSHAGKGMAEDDSRHLWPFARNLIGHCRPAIVIGEQVASALGRNWISGVRANMASLAYSFGAADLCAASTGTEAEGWVHRAGETVVERIVIGAPHIRQRLFWMAHTEHAIGWPKQQTQGTRERWTGFGGNSESVGLVQSHSTGREPGRIATQDARHGSPIKPAGGLERMGEPIQPGLQGHPGNGDHRNEPGRLGAIETGPVAETSRNGPWSDYTPVPCGDGKTRRVESGVAPLVNGLPKSLVPGCDPCPQEVQSTAEARVMRLRGYGNAINPYVAAQFIRSAMEAIHA